MAYDVELEKDIVAASLRSKKFLATSAPLLERQHFSSPTLAWIWSVIKGSYLKHREVPSATLFFARLDREADDDERDHVEDVLLGLLGRRVTSPRSALDEVRRFIKLTAARRAADDVMDGIDDGDLDAVETAIEGSSAELRRASVLSTPQSWTAGAKARLKKYESYGKPGGRVTFKTMSETLNHRVLPMGGLPAGKLAEVLATTNVGKTNFLTDMGFNALTRSAAVVLHITTEDTQTDVETRYDARISGIGRTKLECGQLTRKEKKQFIKSFERFPHIQDNLFVHALPKGHKVTMVGPLLDNVRDQHPRKPVLLVYDSPYHAQGIRQTRERRHELREVFEYIDNQVKDESNGETRMACWVAHHGRRKDAGRVPTAESGAESYDIERIVDFMCGLRDGEDLLSATEKVIELHITKNRIGPIKRAVVYMKADLGTCTFREVEYYELLDDDDDES
jgi:replicative DNA helicase